MQSETQQLTDGITMKYALKCNIQRHVSALKMGHHQVVGRTYGKTIDWAFGGGETRSRLTLSCGLVGC